MSTISLPRLNRLGDDSGFYFGKDLDFWLIYDEATDNAFELWTSDGDGAGTDAEIFNVASGGKIFSVTYDLNVAGQVTLADGSAGDPSIGFDSDDDGSGTGIFRSAADTLAIASNGAQVASFAAGITYLGTAAQAAKLDPTSNSVLKVTSEDGTDNMDIQAYKIGTGGGGLRARSGGQNLPITTAALSSPGGGSGDITLATGNQTHANDQPSGCISLTTGNTTDTDGDSGDITLTTGTAVAGQEDAGDILLQTYGANTRFKVSGATGACINPAKAKTLGVGVTTFAITSNVMVMTGDGGGNTIGTITGAEAGMLLTLMFVDTNITITDTAAGAAGADEVALTGGFTGAAGTTLQLAYSGSIWVETSRAVCG